MIWSPVATTAPQPGTSSCFLGHQHGFQAQAPNTGLVCLSPSPTAAIFNCRILLTAWPAQALLACLVFVFHSCCKGLRGFPSFLSFPLSYQSDFIQDGCLLDKTLCWLPVALGSRQAVPGPPAPPASVTTSFSNPQGPRLFFLETLPAAVPCTRNTLASSPLNPGASS